MTKQNSMGSDVEQGFKCKPGVLDENKPIMYSAIQLFICDGHRCKEVQTEDIAQKVRNIVKELGLENGINRVKVTRTHCNGACRFKNFAYIYKNAKSDNFTPENCFSAWKKVHEWTDEQWKELITSTVNGKEPDLPVDFKVEDKIYQDE